MLFKSTAEKELKNRTVFISCAQLLKNNNRVGKLQSSPSFSLSIWKTNSFLLQPLLKMGLKLLLIVGLFPPIPPHMEEPHLSNKYFPLFLVPQ
ncbi:hypothetical protein V6Z11_D05G327900 [Gossypium hirsutum]